MSTWGVKVTYTVTQGPHVTEKTADITVRADTRDNALVTAGYELAGFAPGAFARIDVTRVRSGRFETLPKELQT